jgi:hypothetical protein
MFTTVVWLQHQSWLVASARASPPTSSSPSAKSHAQP